jgi:hypothetical protein
VSREARSHSADAAAIPDGAARPAWVRGEVAQIGAVIGRDFSYPLLLAVARMEDAPLQMALEQLAEADILLVQGVPPDSEYRFKHALIQDAAFENLLKSRRQVLHRRVAETLRDRFAEMAAAEPEALAHHFTQAGSTHAAIEWWGKAGDQALRRSAFQEAISHLGEAIEMADKAGVAEPTQRMKITNRLPPSHDAVPRLCRPGSESSLHPRAGVCGWKRCGAVPQSLRALSRQPYARRTGFGAGDSRDLPVRRCE